jgi:uncharacterized protein YjbJ (UPF0337 family)
MRHTNRKGHTMSGTDKVEGKAEALKGAAKEKIGDATDNPDLEAEGQGDQAAGEAKEAIADAKDALQEVTKDQ